MDSESCVPCPFQQAFRLQAGSPKRAVKVGLFNSSGRQLVTSPRSVEAIRACGYRPEQLLPREPADFAADTPSPVQRAKLASRWEASRARKLQECQEKYRVLEAEAEDIVKKEGTSAVEIALKERELRQKERTQRIQDAKRYQQEKSLREQLQMDSDRAAALSKVKEKEEQVMRKRAEKKAKQQAESAAKAESANQRREAVEMAGVKQLAELRMQQSVREQRSHELQERLTVRRLHEATRRREREMERAQVMEEKRARCIAEQRKRVTTLLDKRKAKEEQLCKLLEERDNRIKAKAEALAERDAQLREHADKMKVDLAYKRQRSLRQLQSKSERADRLVALKQQMVSTQRDVGVEDRKRRDMLNMWMANAQVTGDYSIPPWVRLELGDIADERSLASLVQRLGSSFECFDATKVTQSAQDSRPWAAPLVTAEPKLHHSRWVWD